MRQHKAARPSRLHNSPGKGQKAGQRKGQRKGQQTGQKRRQQSTGQVKLARNTPDIELEIERVGSRGDGIGTARYTINYETRDWPVFVPGSLAGERVRVRPITATKQGLTAELVELITPSAHRTEPVCAVFGACGGCSFQHMSEAAYQAHKDAQFRAVLAAAGLDDTDSSSGLMRPPVWTPMAARRRARLQFRRTKEAFVTGFAGRASHFIYSLESCAVLRADLKAVTDRLADWMGPCFAPGDTGQIAVNMLSSGADILVLPDQEMSDAQMTALSAAAGQAGLVRLAVRPPDAQAPLLLIEAAPPALKMAAGEQTLYPGPGAFLQASADGEAALVTAVLEAAGLGPETPPARKAPQIVDLYCGAGTFSLPLLGCGARLRGYEADKTAVDSLLAAARAAGFGAVVQAHQRDLAAAPVRAEELAGVDIVLLDPPRQGAAAQIAELVRLSQNTDQPPQVIMVSCNPHSAARELRTLTDAGWQTAFVQMVDQFVRTPHTEMVACLNWPQDDAATGRKKGQNTAQSKGQDKGQDR